MKTEPPSPELSHLAEAELGWGSLCNIWILTVGLLEIHAVVYVNCCIVFGFRRRFGVIGVRVSLFGFTLEGCVLLGSRPVLCLDFSGMFEWYLDLGCGFLFVDGMDTFMVPENRTMHFSARISLIKSIPDCAVCDLWSQHGTHSLGPRVLKRLD